MRKFSILLFVAFACVSAQAAPMASLRGSGEWVRFPSNPVLRAPDDRAIVADPSILFDPARRRYRMWFGHVGVGLQGGPAARIGYGDSPDGVRWSNLAFELVPLGAQGAWDDRHVETPRVIRDDGEPDPAKRFKMWYSGLTGEHTYRIGYATSADGLTWRKLPAGQSPYGKAGLVLDVQDGELAVSDPTVLQRNGRYHLWFSMLSLRGGKPDGGIGYATSEDGIRWRRHPASPVVRGSGWDARWGVEGWPGIPYVLWSGQEYELWYHAGLYPKDARVDPSKQAIGYAASKDGVRWRKLDHPILVPDTSQPSEAQGWFPGTAAIYQGSRTLLYWPAIANNRIALNLAIRER